MKRLIILLIFFGAVTFLFANLEDRAKGQAAVYCEKVKSDFISLSEDQYAIHFKTYFVTCGKGDDKLLIL